MTQFEEDLQYAKDILRIRNALHDGTIDGVEINHGENQDLRYRVKSRADMKIFATIGYFDCTDKNLFLRSESYISKKWIFDFSTSVYEIHDKQSDFPYIPNSINIDHGAEIVVANVKSNYDEAAYFQDSLIYDAPILSNIVLMNYLYDNPLPKPYNKFQFDKSYFELILNLLDKDTQ